MGLPSSNSALSPEELAAVKEYSHEFMEAARYGELDDMNLIYSHPRLNKLIDFHSLADAETGTSPLMLSAANGCLDCVVFLVETVQVDVNRANNSGNTALHWASLTGQSECVHYLISKGADVLRENTFGKTPFDEAIARDHKECCEILVKEEVRLNRMAEGLSPLASEDDLMAMEPIESIAEEEDNGVTE